jgi:hypothetical protein
LLSQLFENICAYRVIFPFLLATGLLVCIKCSPRPPKRFVSSSEGWQTKSSARHRSVQPSSSGRKGPDILKRVTGKLGELGSQKGTLAPAGYISVGRRRN